METQFDTPKKIIEILEKRGPSLPVQLAKEVGMSSLFISAFLSELVREKRVEISNLKIGGSPLYYLRDQVEDLEKFHNSLHQKEIEAFLLLKEKKILKDSEQDPSIRVALRSIRDFSKGFKKDNEIYWKYFSIPDSEIDDLLSPNKKQTKKPAKKEASKQETPRKQPEPINEQKPKPNKEIPKPKEDLSEKQSKISDENIKNEFENPLIIETHQKKVKTKPKSDFVLKTINFLENNNLKIIEEKEYKTKEYNCLIKINSQLGSLNFLTQAKDKKTISESDLKKLLSNSQSIPLPALLIYTNKLSKKAQEYLEKYSSIIKAKKLE